MLDFPLWKKLAIAGLCLLGVVFATPNLWYERADTAARAQADIEAGRYDPADRREFDRLQVEAALWPDFLPPDVVNLGLDLRGGVHLLVEVQVREVIAERLRELRRQAYQALRDAGTATQGRRVVLEDDAVRVRIANVPDLDLARSVLGAIPQPVTSGLGGGLAGQPDIAVADAEDGFALSLTEAGRAALIARTMA